MSPDDLKRLRQEWERSELRECLERQPESRPLYETLSGIPVKRVYGPEDVAETPFEEVGFPGRYPFTRDRIQPCIAAAAGPCASSPDMAPARTPIGASAT